MASLESHVEVVKFLITRGANISKLTPYRISMLSKDGKFISDLVSEGCYLDMTKENDVIKNVRKVFKTKVDLVLKNIFLLIPNVREKIIYTYI